MDIDAHTIGVALNLNLGNAGRGKLFQQPLAQVVVFYKRIAEVRILRIPAGFPILNDTDPQAGGINLLAHCLTSSSLIPFP